MRIAAIIILLVALTACSKEASVTVRSGPGGSVQPFIHCDAVMPNPDYEPEDRGSLP